MCLFCEYLVCVWGVWRRSSVCGDVVICVSVGPLIVRRTGELILSQCQCQQNSLPALSKPHKGNHMSVRALFIKTNGNADELFAEDEELLDVV